MYLYSTCTLFKFIQPILNSTLISLQRWNNETGTLGQKELCFIMIICIPMSPPHSTPTHPPVIYSEQWYKGIVNRHKL